MSILVTGATGAIGRLVVEQLVSRGERVHALTRKPETATFKIGVQVFKGDLTAAPPAEALASVKQVFLFPAMGDLQPFLATLKPAGVEHLVVLSSLAAALERPRDRRSVSAHHHLAVEAAAKATGLPITVLRPGSFANNLCAWAHSIKSTGGVVGPWPKAVQAPIHEADIADAAVAAMQPGFKRGQILPMKGPEALTREQQLRAIGHALGKTLVFRECTPAEFTAMSAKFMPPEITSMLLEYWSETTTEPEVAQGSGRTLAQWAADHIVEFRPA